MLKIESTLGRALVCLFAGGLLTTSACTRMPVSDTQLRTERVNTEAMHVVAETRVGATTRYVEFTTGATVEISVLSEYFSAGGRKCRRFLQGNLSPLSSLDSGLRTDLESNSGTGNSLLPENPSKTAAATKRLACEDSKNGWVEIPVHSITS